MIALSPSPAVGDVMVAVDVGDPENLITEIVREVTGLIFTVNGMLRIRRALVPRSFILDQETGDVVCVHTATRYRAEFITARDC